MSWLLFSGAQREIQLFAGQYVGAFVSAPRGAWEAHNETAATAHGAWPRGTFKWSYYNPHTDQPGFSTSCLSTPFGCSGIHIFDVPGRPGMGVHAGRTANGSSVGGKTNGCIRVSDEAMRAINVLHRQDRLAGIVVR